MLPCFKTKDQKKNKNTQKDYFLPEEEFFNGELEFFLPDFEEDFEISEGATYKGHQGIVRSALKMTHHEFITCCDEGQFIIWNKKKSSMRGFTL